MNVLSIQSHVAYGHVGNAAAAFPCQPASLTTLPTCLSSALTTSETFGR